MDIFWKWLALMAWILTVLPTTVFLLSKCFFLAPYRIGWLMMFANVIYETLFKKFKWHRWCVDATVLPVLVLLWSVTAGPWWGMGIGLLMAIAWAATLRIDQKWRSGETACQDARYAGRVPIPLPRLVVSVRGPVLKRNRIHELGDWPSDWKEPFDLLILNPSTVVPQFPIDVSIESDSPEIRITDLDISDTTCPEPSRYRTIPFSIHAESVSQTPVLVTVRVQHGDTAYIRKLRIRSVFSPGEAEIESAQIRRWKGGARAGFAWRGDQDLYDPATFQNETGLRHALGLSMRFRMPSTLYISGALSLVQEEHKAFCDHFGWDRRSEEIPDFIRFLREEVTMKNEMEFPMNPDRGLAMELGNHMYVHLGTHTGAAEGNNWKSHAWIGDGRYPWQQEGPADSFTEQRDNAIKNSEVILEKLGVKVTSWGVPGRTYDEDTSRAVEAAGIEFGTDTNASAFTNVMRLVLPHHPDGCDHLVEITKKYPGDPDDAYKIAMLKYWANAARRHGGVFLFMAHHHFLLYQGSACMNMINEFFYYLLGDCDGDYYAATVTSLGKYWKAVISPKHKSVFVTCSKDAVTVENKASEKLERLPLEIMFKNGCRLMTLVDVNPSESFQVSVNSKITDNS